MTEGKFQCFQCRKTKPVATFRKAATRSRGHRGTCKVCEEGPESPHQAAITHWNETIKGIEFAHMRQRRGQIDFRAKARCVNVDPNIFHPSMNPHKVGNRTKDTAGMRDYVRKIRQYCEDCPARLTCLTHALDHKEDKGFWGGVGEAARLRWKKAGTTAEQMIKRWDQEVENYVSKN